MNENGILSQALVLINEAGVSEAYKYLVREKSLIKNISGQYYNFLYCLAAINGNDEEAIIGKELWYRTEVFEDEDLDNIRDTTRFAKCFDISEQRYNVAKKNTKTINSWSKKESNKLVLALHGNQQNYEDSRNKWEFLKGKGYQVEYIQSE